jgi:hypothetical protein
MRKVEARGELAPLAEVDQPGQQGRLGKVAQRVPAALQKVRSLLGAAQQAIHGPEETLPRVEVGVDDDLIVHA